MLRSQEQGTGSASTLARYVLGLRLARMLALEMVALL